jgi:hypothetical protein
MALRASPAALKRSPFRFATQTPPGFELLRRAKLVAFQLRVASAHAKQPKA